MEGILFGVSQYGGMDIILNSPQSKKGDSKSMIFNGKRDNEGSLNGGIGIWSSVEPGHGYMFQTNGNSNSLSKMFGPELSFANKMIERW
ncbi:MAG: hypothetical protein CM15mP64_4030 [Candidatus Neomarinimicrobiota bacterium]|nr:MAG: hypothetical protein CM15mP64_4030 [Candidatus Neomarinimicrobiota bacterium]